jgi:Bifunctional DNA primase/polymerase, N-terminal
MAHPGPPAGSELAHLRAQVAAHRRHHGTDDQRTLDAHRNLREAKLAETIQRALTIPVIKSDKETLRAALANAAAGWYVGPVKAGTKHPGSILGRDWQRQTARDPRVISAWFAGTSHRVFLHAGRSGAVIFDVDNPDNLPAPIRQAIEQCKPPHQCTRPDNRRRGHYVFAMPSGRQLGNSLGNLANGWGEIRGTNGVIVVAPSVHPEGGEYRWLSTGTVPMLPGYLATQLPDALDASEAATDADVIAFLAEHGTPSSPRPQLLDIHLRAFQKP